MKGPHRSITRSTISRCVLVEVGEVLSLGWALKFQKSSQAQYLSLFLLPEAPDIEL